MHSVKAYEGTNLSGSKPAVQ